MSHSPATPSGVSLQSCSELEDQQCLQIAQAWMDALMQASTELDYAAHTQHWSARAKSVLTQQQFEQVCQVYQAQKGYFAERRLLGLLRRPHAIQVLWAQQFSNTAGEYLAEMILIEEQGQLKIDHVMVHQWP